MTKKVCPCHDPVTVANALVGTNIGAMALSWDEALALAHQLIKALHGPKKGT